MLLNDIPEDAGVFVLDVVTRSVQNLARIIEEFSCFAPLERETIRIYCLSKWHYR